MGKNDDADAALGVVGMNLNPDQPLEIRNPFPTAEVPPIPTHFPRGCRLGHLSLNFHCSSAHRTPSRVFCLHAPYHIIMATEPTAAIPLSIDFCADDADVVIRAAGTLDFRTHKVILSLVSPVFKDTFTLPQPPPDTPGELPRVDVQDSAKTWENILRTIYPTLPNPTIDTLDDLESLLSAAQTYDMKSVIETHRTAFAHREFIEKDPLRLFAIAWVYGFEDQATYVARNAELVTVAMHSDPSNLKGLTFGVYCRLVSFLVRRNDKWYRILGDAGTSYCSCWDSKPRSVESLYKKIKEHLRQPYVQTEEVYVKALEDLLYSREQWCYSDVCPFKNTKIKEFIQRLIGEREKVCDEFQPAKWYRECAATLCPNPFADIAVLIRCT